LHALAPGVALGLDAINCANVSQPACQLGNVNRTAQPIRNELARWPAGTAAHRRHTLGNLHGQAMRGQAQQRTLSTANAQAGSSGQRAHRLRCRAEAHIYIFTSRPAMLARPNYRRSR